MPAAVPAPVLARIAETLPEGPSRSYEVKWDGYRCLAVKHGSRVTLHSRRGTHGANYLRFGFAACSVEGEGSAPVAQFGA